MDKGKNAIIALLKKETNLKFIPLEIPPDSTLGDYAFPCFLLAANYKKKPNEIAGEFAETLKFPDIIEKVEAKGPYLNFFLNRKALVKEILTSLKKDTNFGSSNEGKGKKITVEHTSINPNASPHVGRLRNAIIGDSLVRLLRFQNYDVTTRYFVNDIGKQIAMLVYGCKGRKKVTFENILQIYSQTSKKVEKSKKVEEEIFQLLHKLENNDMKVRRQFKKIVDVCVKGQTDIFKALGITYDAFDYESEYLFSKKTDDILKKLGKKVFTDEDGRKVLDQAEFKLPMKSPVLVLTRADGTSLYPLRDLAYHLDKKTGENLVVLGEDHKLYNDQINAALTLLHGQPRKLVSYSFILLQEEKMSTRKGNIILAEDFMREALKKAKKEIKKRHGKINEESAISIAYGAVKFAIIRVSPEKNVTFQWDQALTFEGDSGPYLQYAYARIASILRKHKATVKGDIEWTVLADHEDLELVKVVSQFPHAVQEATQQHKPHIVASYLLQLAKKFNEFYHSSPILQEKESIRDARLYLIDCTKDVLAKGLNLIGLEVIEKM